MDWVKKSLKAEGEKQRLKKQTKLNMAKALKEDATIFQYDEIYENLDKTKSSGVNKSAEKKEEKPKYIHNLLKNAERRKREQEHRIERMVQKEREAEGEMFADKESFVTSAYRAKLEEFKKMEEEEERMDRLEAIGDVTKQQDMSGFYRQLFSQTVDGPKIEKESENQESSSKSDEIQPQKTRQYRKRVVEDTDSESSSEDEQEQPEKCDNIDENAAENLDKDSEQEDDEDAEPMAKKSKNSNDEVDELAKDNFKIPVVKSLATEEITKNVKQNTQDVEVTQEPKIEVKKVSIWEKRTVGDVYDAALQRFYARKAARLAEA